MLQHKITIYPSSAMIYLNLSFHFSDYVCHSLCLPPPVSPSLSACLLFWHHRCVYIASRWVLPWQMPSLSLLPPPPRLYLNCLRFWRHICWHAIPVPRLQRQVLLLPVNPQLLMLPSTRLLFFCCARVCVRCHASPVVWKTRLTS